MMKLLLGLSRAIDKLPGCLIDLPALRIAPGRSLSPEKIDRRVPCSRHQAEYLSLPL